MTAVVTPIQLGTRRHGKNIDKMDGLIEQLRAMGTTFDESLAIGILVASIDVAEVHPATAETETFSEQDVDWEDVSFRLIEEVKNIKQGSLNRSYAATQFCESCGKTNHGTAKCFVNPLNSKTKLDLKSKTENSKLSDKGEDKEEETESRTKKKKKKKKKQRSATARTGNASYRNVEKIMLDSGTTSQLSSLENKASNSKSTNVTITLVQDSIVTATAQGTRQVSSKTDDSDVDIKLPNTILVPNLAMR